MNFKIPEYPGLQFGSVFCIGRNYAKHVEEMKSEKTKNPVVFLKPRNSIIFSGEIIRLPNDSKNIQHEVELVLLIGRQCKNVSETDALKYVEAYAVGLDITARDLQSDAKKAGLPWSLSKGFDTFAPVGNFIDYDGSHDFKNITLSVSVNGETRQRGKTSSMIFSANTIISYLSQRFTLYPGDIIFSGTPEGVSQIQRGDLIEASINSGESLLTVHVDV